MTRDEIGALTGCGHYDYTELCVHIDDDDVARYVTQVRQRFGTMAGNWDEATNSEWLARLYLSLKLMLSSQLMVSSLKYAEEHNLLIVEPYLAYYTLLNCCRAFLYASPGVDWRSGALRESTHSKIINVTEAELKKMSVELSAKVTSLITSAKDIRELFSYHFPATGLSIVNREIPFDKVHDTATILCELSEVNSECLASALEKKGVSSQTVDRKLLRSICEYDAPLKVVDSDDAYRTNYFVRHSGVPTALSFMARAGLIEDFFGAWMPRSGDDPTPEQFDPDYGYCGSIFDPSF